MGQPDPAFDGTRRPDDPGVCEPDNPDVDAQLQRSASPTPGGPTSTPSTPGATSTPAPAPATAQGPAAPPPQTLDSALAAGRTAVQMKELVRSTFFPGYRNAVDALAPMAALELARHVVGAMQVVEAGKREVLAAAPDDQPYRWMTSAPDRPDEAEAVIMRKWTALQELKPALLDDLTAFELDLATRIGPQVFRDQPVLGSLTAPKVGADAPSYLAGEAGAAVELLFVIQQARQAAGATGAACPVIGVAERAEIAALVAPWRSRPVNFAFLVRVLSEEGIWEQIEGERTPGGKTLAELDRAVVDQAKETGALVDVGELDTDSLQALLDPQPEPEPPPDLDDDRDADVDGMGKPLPMFGDGYAMTIYEKLAAAAPDARGPLIRQIDRMGYLGAFCDHLPWKHVEAMHDAIHPTDPKAAGLLVPYYANQGGGRSMHQIYMDEVQEDIDEGQEIRAYGWFLLDTLHNAFTGGFQHEYSEAYDANEQGFTTDDQFTSQATKALGKAAAIIAVSTITGTAAGEFAGGVAEGFGAGRSAAQLIGGGVGGFAGGVGGHFAGDVFDQMANGKQGFDSFGDYMVSGAEGGAMGVALAGVSLAAGKYFPASNTRAVDKFAERHPRMTRVLEEIRGTGFSSGRAVRMKVSELLDVLGSGFGVPGEPDAFAYATIGDVRALPPDAEVSVTMRPRRALTQPMQMSRPKGPDGDVDDGYGAAGKDGELAGTEAGEPMVAIERVEVVKDPLAAIDPAEVPVTRASLDPAAWVERLKTMLSADELARFEKMIGKMTPEQIKAQYKGDFDAALQTIKGATAKGNVSTERGHASQARAAELRAAIESRGLMNDPEVAEVIAGLGESPTPQELRTAVNRIRNRVMGEILDAETAARYPGAKVLHDVEIWVEQPQATVEAFKAAHPKQEGNWDVFPTANGDRVHIKATDVDVMVVQGRPDGGKARIVHREEVKTGTRDTHARAKSQLDQGALELSKAARGEQQVRLRSGGTDVTDQIDLTDVASSTGATRGPARKGFDESLEITANDLETLVEELVAAERNSRSPGGTP